MHIDRSAWMGGYRQIVLGLLQQLQYSFIVPSPFVRISCQRYYKQQQQQQACTRTTNRKVEFILQNTILILLSWSRYQWDAYPFKAATKGRGVCGYRRPVTLPTQRTDDYYYACSPPFLDFDLLFPCDLPPPSARSPLASSRATIELRFALRAACNLAPCWECRDTTPLTRTPF
jgi:hypothetical protein